MLELLDFFGACSGFENDVTEFERPSARKWVYTTCLHENNEGTM